MKLTTGKKLVLGVALQVVLFWPALIWLANDNWKRALSIYCVVWAFNLTQTLVELKNKWLAENDLFVLRSDWEASE